MIPNKPHVNLPLYAYTTSDSGCNKDHRYFVSFTVSWRLENNAEFDSFKMASMNRSCIIQHNLTSPILF